MFGFSTLSELFDNVIATKFVKNVVHSVIMKPGPNGKGFKPAASIKNKYLYVGPDDSKGFSCYCRQNGSLTVDKSELIGAGNRLYKTVVPHRLVFFNDSEERSHEDITAILMSAVIKTKLLRLVAVHIQNDIILKQEVPTGKFNFTPKTFYIAIDFNVLLDVKYDNCAQEITCENVLNPYCGSTE